MVSNYEFNQYKQCIDSCLAEIKTQIAALGGGGSYVIADGNSTQYIKGDGTKATFPTIPSNADYVDKSTNQTNLGGNKNWTGTHTFGVGIVLTAGATPTTNGSGSIGSSSFRFNGAFFTTLNIGAASTFGGAVTLSSVAALATAASVFLVADSGVVKSRTAAQMLSDLNGAAKVSALDFEITDQTKGLIQKDRGDSIRKRLVVTNGVSTWEAA